MRTTIATMCSAVLLEKLAYPRYLGRRRTGDVRVADHVIVLPV